MVEAGGEAAVGGSISPVPASMRTVQPLTSDCGSVNGIGLW